MIDAEQGNGQTAAPGILSEPEAGLPYRIELCAEIERDRVERVLGRAHSALLAQAIFKAAQTENPGRRVTLRQGGRLIAESAA